MIRGLGIGIAVGIALEIGFHVWHGTPFTALFKPEFDIVENDPIKSNVLVVKRACVFSNWFILRSRIVRQLAVVDELTVDLSQSKFVDHSVHSKLHDLTNEYEADGKRLIVTGLENHKPLSSHPQASRKQLPPALVPTSTSS